MDDDDIVIVGVGCKFPGADNLEEFWRVLANGENHVKEIPKERWNVDAFYDPDPNATGRKTYVRKAGFINRYDEWDHHFFGINDMEAEIIDPQQRLVLDCVHMALEDGGITRKDMDKTQTGVYIGCMNDDYKAQSMEATNLTNTYLVTSIHTSIISARVSYVYNLFGPAMTIDTACSSSLVAVHVASQALKLGDIDAAICGGVNLMLDPVQFIPLSKARMLSPTGQCQAFSADADGYARGEGCGIVILKKFKQAVRDGNKIWGIINTGSNQDGHMMSPITAPSGEQQAQLLEKMYRKYNVNKDHMQVIEAHGTGTPIGDPIESNTLGQFFRSIDNMKEPHKLYIGSVKTNIGHTEAAAGVAGLIKVLLMMKNEQIVASLMYKKSNENPKIQFHQYGIEVATKTQPWVVRNNHDRLACVNSFGFGGTNAHTIVKEFVHKSNLDTANSSHKRVLPYLIAITAPSNESLQANVRNFLSSLKGHSYNMGSLSFTSTCKRDLRRLRKCFAVESQDSLIELCEKQLSSKQQIRSRNKPKLVFVFCGVGTTWNGMCQDMFKFDVFDQAVQEIDKKLKPLTGWHIREKLMEGNEVVSNPLIAHIAIFSCQVGILALMRDFGLSPDAVVGQSVGEVAAAYASGSIDIDSAVQIIYHRSTQLSNVLKGGMAVVKGIPLQRVDDFCKASDKVINIAVFNSPTSCTVSGDKAEIVRLRRELLGDVEGDGAVIDLDVHCAYHSSYVAQAAANLQSSLKSLESGSTSIPIVSTVTGNQEPYELFSQPNYWKDNMQYPVKFQDAIETVSNATEGTFYVEIGPSPVLNAHLKHILKDKNNTIAVPTMRKQKDSNKSLADTICALFEYGFDPKWTQIVPCHSVVTESPKYTFTKHKSLFIPEKVTLKNEGIFAVEKENSHMYCKPVPSEDGFKEIEATVNEATTPFVFQHIVKGTVILPGAFYVDIGFEIGKFNFDFHKDDLSIYAEFVKPVKVESGETLKLKTDSSFAEKNCIRFNVKHRDSVVCIGKVTKTGRKMRCKCIDIQETKMSLKTNEHVQIDADELYESIRKMGIEHGRCFQVIKSCITNGKCSLVELEIPDDVMSQADTTTLHPCVLDGMLHSTFTLSDDKSTSLIKDENLIMMAVAIESIKVFKPVTKRMLVITREANVITLNSVLKFHYNMQLLDSTGTVLAEVTNYMSYSRRHSHNTPDELKYRLNWKMLDRYQPIDEESKVIVIDTTNDRSCSNLFENNEWVVCKFSPIQHKELRHFFANHVTSVAEDRWGSIKKADALVILFGKETKTTLTIADANAVYQSIKNNCLFLVAFLKTLMEMQFKIPLFITTQNTKCINGVYEDIPMNLIGNDIWGFIRNVQIEFAHSKMTLVDVIPSIEATSSSLVQYVNANHATIEQSHAEIAICQDNIIYCSEFTKTDMTEITPMYFDHICLPHTVPLGIFSESQYCIVSPFLKPNQKENSTMVKRKDGIDVVLTSIFIHPASLFRITTTQESVNHFLNDEGAVCGHLVFGLEYSGLPVRKVKKGLFRRGDSTAHVDKLGKSMGVVAVFPQSLTTVVHVPHECCVMIKDLPFYEPGMLAKSVMYLTMLKYVPKKSNVICITNETDRVAIKLLQTFLETQRFSHIVPDDQTADVVLVTCRLKDKDYDNIVKAKRVIFVKDTIETKLFDMLLRLRHGEKKDCIAVDPYDVFEENHIAENLKIAVRTLQKHPRFSLFNTEDKNENICKNKHAVDISLQVRTAEGEITLPVKTKLEKLFVPSDIVIMTGGLTGLGWQILLLLAEIGVGTIATLSRRTLSKEKANDVKDIENQFKCNIECVQADVTDISSLQNAILLLQNKHKQCFIRGVIHGAGVVEAINFFDVKEENLEKVMNPKILGTMNMHMVTRNLNLDFFFMHSSLSSHIGRPMNGSYGAANAFIDTFAHWRRQQGLPVQTINWGALSVGMAAREEFAGNFVKRGYLLLPIPEIRSCFLQALMENTTGTIYAKMDWGIIVKDLSLPPMFRTKLRFDTMLTQKNIKSKESSVDALHEYDQARLQTCDRPIQMLKISKLVDYVITRVVGVEIHKLQLSSTLAELGIDSMSAVTFVNVVYDITGFRMMQSFLMDTSRCVHEIVTFLVDALFGTAKGEEMKTSESPVPVSI